MPKSTTDFHEANRASEILSKIGKGTADIDFARTIHEALDAAELTGKKAKVIVTVEIEPNEERGCLLLRAGVSAKIPKLSPPASQMHRGPRGELLTQQDFLLGGGRDERPEPIPSKTSGRMSIVGAPAPAPLASAPAPKPLVGKDAAAGRE